MNENTMNNAVTMRPDANASLGRIDQYELIRELGGAGSAAYISPRIRSPGLMSR